MESISNVIKNMVFSPKKKRQKKERPNYLDGTINIFYIIRSTSQANISENETERTQAKDFNNDYGLTTLSNGAMVARVPISQSQKDISDKVSKQVNSVVAVVGNRMLDADLMAMMVWICQELKWK